MKKTLYLIAVLALGLTACSKNEIRSRVEDPSGASVYRFSLPASLGDGAGTKALTFGESSISSTFSSTDKVYVFIERSGDPENIVAMAHNGVDEPLYLSPSDISGATCTLEGALTFYVAGLDEFVAFEPSADDVVYLYYNLNRPEGFDSPTAMESSCFAFGWQNGSKDQDVYLYGHGDPFLRSQGVAACHFAQARMKVTEVAGDGTDGYSLTMVQDDDETKSNVHFEYINSMFRQHLGFTDKDNQPVATLPEIRQLDLSFDGDDAMVYFYTPRDPVPYWIVPGMTISDPVIPAEGDLYYALMFYDDNKDLPLVLKVKDVDGNVYSAVKDAPEGGFRNGQYYYGEATLAWQKCVKPVVSGTEATPVEKDVFYEYKIEEDPVNLTVSGDSEDYTFAINSAHGGTITLDNLAATVFSRDFIYPGSSCAGDFTIVLKGSNSIRVLDRQAISLRENLKLSCTGESATLTVTEYETEQNCGIKANNYSSDTGAGVNYNEYATSTAVDVSSMLAAPGYTVIRSARTSDADELGPFFTWTYTVTPANP